MALSIREELHKMIDEADEERVNEMYGLLNDEDASYGRYSDEDLAMFYRRLEEHEAGGGGNLTIEESLSLIRNSKE